MDFRQVEANAISFSYLEAGPADGPLALCLHGFPDSPMTWRHLLPVLAEAGYHAVAPAMRGYAPSSLAPDGGYQVGALASDANAIHEALGGGSDAVLIGHDWGAPAVYGATNADPGRWRRAVAMSVPPMALMVGAFMTYEQLRRSWYMFFFQNPLADVVVGLEDLRFIDRLWADWSPGYDAAEDLGYVKAGLAGPEHLAAALGYYRAMFDPNALLPAYAAEQEALAVVGEVPTLYLHGRGDGCISVEAAGDPLPHLPPGSAYEVVEGAGHFLQLEQPSAVNAAISRFLA